MAQVNYNINLTIPDALALEMVNLFAPEFGYSEMIPDGLGGEIPNPQTKAQFVNDYMQVMIKSYTKNYIRTLYKSLKSKDIEDITITE